MAVTYRSDIRTNRLNLVVNALGSSAAPVIATVGASAGSLVIGTAALSGSTGVLAVFPLDQTPGIVSGDTLTLSGMPKITTAVGSGEAAKAELRDNSGSVVVSGLSVGTSSADVIITGTIISYGQTVNVLSGAIAHPAA
jgi:hypothetical protein